MNGDGSNDHDDAHRANDLIYDHDHDDVCVNLLKAVCTYWLHST